VLNVKRTQSFVCDKLSAPPLDLQFPSGGLLAQKEVPLHPSSLRRSGLKKTLKAVPAIDQEVTNQVVDMGHGLIEYCTMR